MSDTATDVNFEEEHDEAGARDAGLVREDNPELDEALDPELGEESFEVEIDPSLEEKDIHDADEALGGDEEAPETRGPRVSPRSTVAVKGMGKVFDFRGTGLCSPNGGRMRPLIMVHHIPVVRNVAGSGDLIRLGEILRAQGLAIQAATDAEGNVALYTRFDELCFGQRGANQFGCGVEHMHFAVDEPWTEKQMRAAAWLANRVWVSHGIPPRGAVVTSGSRIVGVKRRGHTTHKAISDNAGFRDRSDPGVGFNFAHLYELTRFFNKNGRF